jgi:hypothetical protein
VAKAMVHVCFADPKICSMVGKSERPRSTIFFVLYAQKYATMVSCSAMTSWLGIAFNHQYLSLKKYFVQEAPCQCTASATALYDISYTNAATRLE